MGALKTPILLVFGALAGAYAEESKLDLMPEVQAFVTKAKSLGWKEAGLPKPNTNLELTFALKLQNTGTLKERLQQISDPSSPEYGKYLTREQVQSLTGPRQEDVEAVKKVL